MRLMCHETDFIAREKKNRLFFPFFEAAGLFSPLLVIGEVKMQNASFPINCFVAAAVLFLLLPLMCPAMLFGQVLAEIDTRIDTEGVIQNRVQLSGGGTGVYLFLQESGEKEPDFQCGFYSPHFLCGPVRYGGGLRELSNPGGYSAASAVYTEKTGMLLCKELAVKHLFGASLQTAGKEFGIGGTFHDRSRRLDGGVWGNLYSGSLFSLNAAFLGSYNRKKCLLEEPWTADTSPLPAQTVLHIFGNALLRTEVFSAAAACGLSASKIKKPGLFFRCNAALSLPFLQADAAAALILPDYLTPEGERPGLLFSAGGSGTIFPNFPFHLSGGYTKRIERPDIFPQMYLPGEDEWHCAAELETESICGGIEWECEKRYDSFGTLSGEETFSADISLLLFEMVEAGGGCRYGYTEAGEPEISIPACLVLRLPAVKIAAETTIYPLNTFFTENRLRLDIRGDLASAFLLFKVNINGGFSDLYLQFGWSVEGGS